MRVETMHNVILRRSVRVLAVAALAAIPSAVSAQTWVNPAGGNWSVGTNWSGGVVPASAATTALSFTGGGYTATNDVATQPFVLNSLTSTATSATTIAGGTLSFSGTSPAIRNNGSGNLTISSAVNFAASTTIAGTGSASVFLTGPLSTSGGSFGAVMDSGTTTVGFSGGGTLDGFVVSRGRTDITGGTYTLNNATNPGAGPGVIAGVPVIGISVGNVPGASATLNLNGGANIQGQAVNMYAGNVAGATGTFNISGAGTILQVDGATGGRFGVYGGTGNINFSDGATASIRLFEVGRVGGSTANVTITGSGTTVVATQTVTGRGGNTAGEASTQGISVESGATASLGNLFAAAGSFTTSNIVFKTGAQVNIGQIVLSQPTSTGTTANGTITVDGAGTVMTGLNAFVGGPNSTSKIKVTDGAQWSSSILYLGLSGSTATASGTPNQCDVFVGGNGAQMDVGSGGTGQLVLGSEAFSNASMTVAAGGTVLTNFADIGGIRGQNSNATLLVDSGNFIAQDVTMGSGFTSGTANGSTNTWIIRNGGTATVGNQVLIGRNIAPNTGAQTGKLVVDGSGSSLVSGALFVLGLSQGANSSMTVSNSGSVTAATEFDMATDVGVTANLTVASGTMLVGTNMFMSTDPGSTSVATIGGAGASFQVLGQLTLAGGGGAGVASGNATMNINTGATVSSNTAFIGVSDTAGSGVGRLNVSGGTYSAALIAIAASGTNERSPGVVAVSSGGSVTVDDGNGTGEILIGTAGTLTATGGTITAGFLDSPTNSATGGIVNIGTGATLNLNFVNTQSTNTVFGATSASLNGGGTVNINAPLFLQVFFGETSTFSGTVNVQAGFMQVTGKTAGHGQVFNGANIVVGPDSGFFVTPANESGTNPRVPSNVLVVNSISIDATGVIDVSDNDVIVRAGGTSLAAIRTFIANKDLVGTTDYVTNASTGKSYVTLGAISNHDVGGNKVFTTYDGVALGLDDVLVKYTYVGDTNLDGILNGADLSNIIEGLSTGKSGWQWGDVDYSGGAVTAADFAAFMEAYNYVTGLGGAAPSFGNGLGGSNDGGSVPEPTSLALLVPAVSLLSRRRRQA